MFLFRLIVVTTIFFQLNLNNSFADLVKKIEIYGNERISKETVQMFSNISINEDIACLKASSLAFTVNCLNVSNRLQFTLLSGSGYF